MVSIKKRILFILLICFVMCYSNGSKAFGQQKTHPDTWEYLRSRPYPQWFKDAKLGIFIHWGVYSVPSYCGPESYSEWFLRGIQSGAQDRIEFMKKNYGTDFKYEDFAPLFKAELFDADEWAGIFERSGAKYIIFVSKHHDGYCMWPSKYAPGWNSAEVGPMRDIVGEVAEAVKKRNIRLGLYYSLPEWNNPLHRWYIDPHDSIGTYVESHMIPQYKELISTYKPDLLFTDGEWFNTAEQWHARELIAWYYNEIGADAIVNDRWGSGSNIGYITPEYSSGGVKTNRPWAEVRGLGRSFALNRNEKLDAYLTSKELIHLFARTVGYGGGLTINVGPSADGKIPLLQQERLEDLGAWIKINEEAIYASTTWKKPGEEKEVELKRIDPQIHFDWVRNSPGYPIEVDHFKAQWDGFIQADFSEEYTFSALADDGIRLYIDNKLVIDRWEKNTGGTDSEAMNENRPDGLSGKILLEKGKKYPIKVEYHESLLEASISLYWKSASQSEALIPQKNLFSAIDITHGDGLNATYSSMRQYVAYTHKHGNLYAIVFEWPDNDMLSLPVEKPVDGTKISLLGRKGFLPWSYSDSKLIIDLKGIGYNELPNHNAWTFKIENYR